ncbi:hypothetical protein EJB05_15278, partial [Eragrostis curvula]
MSWSSWPGHLPRATAPAPRSAAAVPCAASDYDDVSSTLRGTLPVDSQSQPATRIPASASEARGGDEDTGKQNVDGFTVAGAVRPLVRATEIEEAPPSPPPLSCLLPTNTPALRAGPSPATEIEEEAPPSPPPLSRLLPANTPARRVCLSPATEIEEAPPSPPPLSRVLAVNSPAQRVGLAAGAGLGLEARTSNLRRRAAMPPELLESRLQQLGPERGELQKVVDAATADREDTAALLERFTLRTEMLQEAMTDSQGNIKRLDFQGNVALQEVPMGEEMQPMQETPMAFGQKAALMAWTEDYMELQRRMNKIRITWFKKQIAFAIAFSSVLLVLLIHFRTSLPLRYLSHIAGAFAVLWTLGSIIFFRGLVVTSRAGLSCHVERRAYICFTLFVVLSYVNMIFLFQYRLAKQVLTEMQILMLHLFSSVFPLCDLLGLSPTGSRMRSCDVHPVRLAALQQLQYSQLFLQQQLQCSQQQLQCFTVISCMSFARAV